MMKVLYIIDTLEESGAERSLVEITSRFKEIIPIFVHIYCGDFLKKDLESRGIKVYSLDINGNYSFGKAVESLIPIYEKEKPDVVHSSLFRSDMVTRRLKTKFPHIILVSSFVNNSYNFKRFEQASLLMKIKLKLVQLFDTYTSKKVDFFISNSETIKMAKSESTKVPLDKVKVIYRGRDMNRFSKDFEENELNDLRAELGVKNKKVLLNVSRLIERKGQKDMIKAMPSVLQSFPGTVLLIAGEGPFRNELTNLIRDLQLEEKVILLGRRNDIPKLLELADIFLFPSYFEGLPGALIEAMLSNLLIVCSNIPENLECVDETSAVFFKAGDIEDISEKIITSLNNYPRLIEKSEEAKIQAQEKFDINRISGQYENFYFRIGSTSQIDLSK